MIEYVIEKDVPRPPIGLAAILRSMEVDDSVRVPHLSGASSAISRVQRTSERKFTTKTVLGGIRIWRTA